jgi:ADP-ribose pyrophosphatase
MRKTTIYDGSMIGLDVYNLTIQKRKVRRDIIRHPGVAAILAFDENDKVILVRQHRFPRGYVLEIPAGTIDEGESPKHCAIREIQEETGYKAKKMTHLITYSPSISYNMEEVHCFVAKEVEQGKINFDNDEFITVKKMDFSKLVKLIKSGKIIDSKTICAVMVYAARKKLL